MVSKGCFATAEGMNLLLLTAGNAGSSIMNNKYAEITALTVNIHEKSYRLCSLHEK